MDHETPSLRGYHCLFEKLPMLHSPGCVCRQATATALSGQQQHNVTIQTGCMNHPQTYTSNALVPQEGSSPPMCRHNAIRWCQAQRTQTANPSLNNPPARPSQTHTASKRLDQHDLELLALQHTFTPQCEHLTSTSARVERRLVFTQNTRHPVEMLARGKMLPLFDALAMPQPLRQRWPMQPCFETDVC